jgi:hypothetical protein
MTALKAYSIQHTAYSIQHTAYSIQHTKYNISTAINLEETKKIAVKKIIRRSYEQIQPLWKNNAFIVFVFFTAPGFKLYGWFPASMGYAAFIEGGFIPW